MPLTGTYEPSTNAWAREQAETYQATDGREANTLQGRPIIVLTSVGAKSGNLRINPLMRIEHGGSYAILASNGGSLKNPTWYNNVVKHPHVELQDGADKSDFYAHLAEGEERAQWWKQAVKTWPDFDKYVIGLEREIPVFVLTPLPANDERR
ncbi:MULTISPECIES: nitroreductase family deazaflavin-dependent oxidoreductase [unclassified Rathayibacter]|uniref:nitroreductase family deazaflavin-dependent oxidoreductase n=1 Tax=unclassified Rathayibacter TaxID=2609250 RepID=UPI00188AF8B9|nr:MULTISPECIES: nitroreductase family deazaflavin-dependent oxidoreductase [unclassified Rathayibacter]MBF4461550.1 nitroreductase family deazaflavin-dependent oxidoreductase [Rathayibacter sp. VKM Ac-2879]MBF4502961.1 nitroreductase family deazaflavin-dependent oxidoreductase [Rathayibacter sp. VKM Ac-2878]